MTPAELKRWKRERAWERFGERLVACVVGAWVGGIWLCAFGMIALLGLSVIGFMVGLLLKWWQHLIA